LTACAGSRAVPFGVPASVGSADSRPDASGGAGILVLTIKVPKHAKLRGRPSEGFEWTSPGTESVSVAVREKHAKGVKRFFFVLKPKTKGCSGGTAVKPLLCTFSLSVPSGSDAITIEALGGVKHTSALLAEGSVVRTVGAGKKAALRVTMDGAARWLMLWIGDPYPPVGAAFSQSLHVTAFDAWGFVIIGTFEKPVLFSDSDATGATHLSRTRAVSTKQAHNVVLSYTGAAIAPAIITASSKSAKAKSSAALEPGVAGLIAYPQALFADLGTPGTTLLIGGSGTALPYAVDLGTDALGNASCAGLVNVAPATATTYLVTPIAIGECSLDVSDSDGHRLGVPAIVQAEPDPPGNPTPGPSPTATPPLGAVVAQPAKVTICPSSGAGVCSPSTSSLAISQSGYSGSFRENDDCAPALAVVSPAAASTQNLNYNVAGGSTTGECHATFTGSAAETTVTIDVTASGWIINTSHKGELHQ
jgi:hypothetical protein